MSILSFDIGEEIRLSVAFTDVLGAPTDPTTVTLKIKTPDGDETTFTSPAVFNDTLTVGGFYMDYQIAQAGDHFWRWEGAGALIAANEGVFCGKASHFS